MSPEQARGELTDGRTDVYSLGIVLYEILAGHLPFEGETTMGVLMKHINEPPTPVPGLPPAMQNVLDRALAKDVDDRFQTPAEFGEAFNMAIQGKADFATLDVVNPKPTRKASKRIFKEKKKKRPAWIMPVLAACPHHCSRCRLYVQRSIPASFWSRQHFDLHCHRQRIGPGAIQYGWQDRNAGPRPPARPHRRTAVQGCLAPADQAVLIAMPCSLLQPAASTKSGWWMARTA